MNKATQEVMFSSEKQDWGTPQKFFDECNYIYGPFDFDAAASKGNAKCEIYLGPDLDYDALSMDWMTGVVRQDRPKVWLNPPYGRGIGKWVQKAYEESLKGAEVCCLLPARVDTKWYHEYCIKGQVIFIKGRLKFEGAKHGAPFPSMLVLFGY